MRNLQSFIQILSVVRQSHITPQHPLEIDGQRIKSSRRYILKGMLQKTLLLELLNQCGMHVQVHGGIVPREVELIVPKDLLLDGDGIKDKFEVRMALEIA
jgi:hypothetical protein